MAYSAFCVKVMSVYFRYCSGMTFVFFGCRGGFIAFGSAFARSPASADRCGFHACDSVCCLSGLCIFSGCPGLSGCPGGGSVGRVFRGGESIALCQFRAGFCWVSRVACSIPARVCPFLPGLTFSLAAPSSLGVFLGASTRYGKAHWPVRVDQEGRP